MTYADRAAEAKKRRQAEIRRLRKCACLWPLVVNRNGSGHDGACPVHLDWTAERAAQSGSSGGAS